MLFKSSYLKISITGVFLLGTALVIWNQTCRADDDIVETYHLLSFRAAPIFAFQSGGNSFSGILNWDPYYKFKESRFGIHFNFGVSAFSGAAVTPGAGNTIFTLLEESVLGSYTMNDRLSVEVGPGMQQWINNGGNQMAFMVNGVYTLPKNLLKYIDRVYVGYTGVLISSLYTSEIRAGIGANF